MNDKLNIHSFEGYAAQNNSRRACRNGNEYTGIIPEPVWHETKVRRDATVSQTVNEMRRIVERYAYQTRRLASDLKGRDLKNTCDRIWNFLFEHIKYKEDDKGKEQLRTPSRSWAERQRRGIDCDDFSIFASTILYNLNIPHYLRIARYKGKDYYQHVYVVVPVNSEEYITVDPVLDEYDLEKEPEQVKDYIVMNTNNLNGIDISVLNGIGDETFSEIADVMLGTDFAELEGLQGLGETELREKELNALYSHLVRTRDLLLKEPDLVKYTENPAEFISMLDYAIRYWNTDKREEALSILQQNEERMNRINNLNGMEDGYEDVTVFFGVQGLNGVQALGKITIQKNFFNSVKNAVQNAGQVVKNVTSNVTTAASNVTTAASNVVQSAGGGIKTAVQAVVKYNPVSIAARGGFLFALKTNLFHLAGRLKWGYLTESEAIEKGFDAVEFRKLKRQLQNAEDLFVNVMQGQASNFKEAILTGRAGGLNGIGLGIEPVTTTAAASTAAATPFIAKVAGFLKEVDFGKLFSKIKDKRLAKQAREDADNSKDTPPTDTGDNSNAKTGDDGGGGEESFLDKAMTWVKENPTTSVLIAGGAAFALFPGVRKAVGLGTVTRRGKTNKGKKKSKIPRTITGTGKKRRGKRNKGKGGSGSHIVKL